MPKGKSTKTQKLKCKVRELKKQVQELEKQKNRLFMLLVKAKVRILELEPLRS